MSIIRPFLSHHQQDQPEATAEPSSLDPNPRVLLSAGRQKPTNNKKNRYMGHDFALKKLY
jgi:hypothetical protein